MGVVPVAPKKYAPAKSPQIQKPLEKSPLWTNAPKYRLICLGAFFWGLLEGGFFPGAFVQGLFSGGF